jgi:hypothetical protein
MQVCQIPLAQRGEKSPKIYENLVILSYESITNSISKVLIFILENFLLYLLTRSAIQTSASLVI